MKDKHTGGRPTLYSSAMQQAAEDYLAGFGFEGDGTIKRAGEMKEVVPTVSGLSLYLGVNKTTLYEWAETHTDFSNTLQEIKERQHSMLLSGGLTKTYDSAITRLMLANHGYSDKQQVEHSGGVTVVFDSDDAKL